LKSRRRRKAAIRADDAGAFQRRQAPDRADMNLALLNSFFPGPLSAMIEPPSKADLRRQVRERLRAVPDEELAVWSQELVSALQAREDLWATPGTVAIFGGLRNEPDLITGLLPWLTARGWRVVLFAVDGVELRPFEVTGMHDLKRGMLGIWE